MQQEWDTIAKPAAVSFYRRSLTEITDAITSNVLVISQMSEGKVSQEAKEKAPETYAQLNTKPNFIFIKCHPSR